MTAKVDDPSTRDAYGTVLREWRRRRRMSQLDLALAADVSQRHLSFLETGRAKPSREMVGHLARVLRIEPREHNALLLAAGFSPDFGEARAEDLGEVGRAVEFLLEAHEPNMAIVVDRQWNVTAANTPALSFISGLSPDPPTFEGHLNAMVLLLHPDGLRSHLTNVAEIAPALLWRLRSDTDRAPTDRTLRRLLDHLTDLAGPHTEAVATPPHAGLILTMDFDLDQGPLRLFSCLASLESPTDLTVAELRIETFFPADEASRATWSAMVASPAD